MKVVLVLFLLFHWFVPGWFFCVVFHGPVFVEGFVGSYYFMQLGVLMSFFFLFGVYGRECILIMWYLEAALLSSMGQFKKKLMVISVVAGLWNTSVSR